MRVYIIMSLLMVFHAILPAQDMSGYEVFNIPASARIMALGGTNVSVVEPELSLADQNPSLLCPEMSSQIAVSYSNYTSSVNSFYGAYAHKFNDVGTWSAGLRFVNFGHFSGYDEFGQSIGSFVVQDMAFQGGVAYPLGDKWRVGSQLRLIYSSYAGYKAWALGVDIGLNYYDEQSGTSFGIAATNIGGQLKPLYEGRSQKMPTQIALGFTRELKRLPICISVTAHRLLDWDDKYVNGSGEESSYSNGEMLLNHLIFGAEWIVTDKVYLALSYNYRNQRRFSGQGGFLRGLSFGGGIKWKKFDFQVAYSRYNATSGTLNLQVNYAYNSR